MSHSIFSIRNATILFVLGLMLAGPELYAQLPRRSGVLNRTLNRAAERAAERAIERKIEEALTEDGDEVEARDNEAEPETPATDSDVNVTIEEGETPVASEVEANRFTGSFRFESSTEKRGKVKDQSEVKFFVDSYRTAFVSQNGSSDESSIMIYDKRHNTITTKTESDGSRSAVRIRAPRIRIEENETESQEADTRGQLRKTGEVRTIEGHRCEQYIGETDETTTEIWIATDLSLQMSDLLGNMIYFQSNQSSTPGPMNSSMGAGGVVMESHLTDKKSGEITHNYLRDLRPGDPEASVFSLSGYRVMDLSGRRNR